MEHVHPPNNRMARIEPSPTVGIANKVSQLKSQGQDIVSFSVGEPDFNTPRHIVEAAKDALDRGKTHYAPSNGIMDFREAIAEKSVRKNAIPTTADDVLVAPCKHCLFMSVMALTEEGDEVLIQDPAWVSYEAVAKIAGSTPVEVDTRNDEFIMKPEAVAEAITDRTKLLILNTPSNPTGQVMSREDLKGIAELAEDHDFFILADEIYENIIYDGEHHSIASFDGLYDRTITINGLSKSYAMTGWRVGWLVAPHDIHMQVAMLQQHTITCIPPFIQFAGIAALRGPDEPIKEMVAEFRARRDLMMRLMDETGIFEVVKPEGAFYLFPKFSSEMSSMEFAKTLLEEAGVAITPGIAFGPSCDNHVRFSYAASRQRIQEGFDRIEDAIKRGKV